MKRIIRNLLDRLGFAISRKHPVERRARQLYARYSAYTMIPETLFVDNLKLVWEFRNVPGSVVECGVWRGGMSAGMAAVLPDKEFFLFDSFEGLPPAQVIDGPRALAWQGQKDGPSYYDNCTAEITFARTALQSTGVKFHLVKGWFKDVLPATTFEQPIAILRLDGDWYDSIMECLTHLYPLVTHGGVIILDDYYAWDGCSRAVHDYLAKYSLTAKLHQTASGVPYMVKKD